MIKVIITPISIMPSVEPITDTDSAVGAGVTCNEAGVAVCCAAAGAGLKFAITSANAMNKIAMLKK